MSFRSYNYKFCTISNNKVVLRNPNKNDKELQDDDKITKYPHVPNKALSKYFDDKDQDISSYMEELKNI